MGLDEPLDIRPDGGCRIPCAAMVDEPSRMPRRRIACLLLVFGSLILPASASAAVPASPLALGVNVANGPDQLAPLQSYASLAGANPSIVMWYQQWSEPLFYSTQLPNTKAVGAIPMITWDPTLNGTGIPLAQIADGDYDSYITQSADAARAWNGPIYIRFAHEMNLDDGFGPGQNGNTAADFIAAWRHVVTIFRQQGATNVEWVWSPNVDCGGQCPFTSLYPGAAWVDWVALDGYNYSSVDDVPWESFDQIFKSSYRELTSLTSKPMMIAETASAEQDGNKAQWITQTFSDIAQNYPQIHAVVWFDRVKETDWTVNSSPSSLAAWQTVVASPGGQGSLTTLLQEAPLASDVDSQTGQKTTSTTPTTTPTTTITSTTPTTTSTTTTVTVPPATMSPPATSLTATVAPVATAGPPAVTASPPASGPTSTTPSTPATTVPPFSSNPAATPPTDADSALANTLAARVRSAVTAALHGVLSQSGGPRGLVRSLRSHGYTMSFRAPSAGMVTVDVDLTTGTTGHAHATREAIIATVRRRVSSSNSARITIRTNRAGRHILTQTSRARITIKLGFTSLGRPRLAISESVSSG